MITLSKRAERMIRYAVLKEPTLEVGGYAKLERDQDSDELYITDVLIPPQEVAGAAMDFGEEGVAWTMMQLAARGETLSDWPVWWHSHAGMSPGHSSQDTETLQMFSTMMAHRWAIGIVTNVKGEYDCWTNSNCTPWPFGDGTVNVEKKDIPITLEAEAVNEEEFALVAAMMERVTKQVSVFPSQGGFASMVHQGTKGFDQHARVAGEWGKHCTHQPNCRQKNCLSKQSRKEWKAAWDKDGIEGLAALRIKWERSRIEDENDIEAEDDDQFFGTGFRMLASGDIQDIHGNVYDGDNPPAHITDAIHAMADQEWYAMYGGEG